MTRSFRIALSLVGVAVVLLALKIAISMAHPPSDEVLIKQALADSLEASKKGQPGGVMELLSKDLKVNQESAPESSEIGKFIKESRPDIEILNQTPVVSGDSATIVSPVDLKLSLFGQSVSQHIDSVTLSFRKEQGRGFLFLPVPKWRLFDVTLPRNEIPTPSG